MQKKFLVSFFSPHVPEESKYTSRPYVKLTLTVCVFVFVCVCVHHINRSGPNLMIISLEKTKCGCRSGPWSAGQEGKRETKRSRSGVQIAKMNAKTIPPESEIRNIQSSGKPPPKQNKNRNRKASESIIDTNDRER